MSEVADGDSPPSSIQAFKPSHQAAQLGHPNEGQSTPALPPNLSTRYVPGQHNPPAPGATLPGIAPSGEALECIKTGILESTRAVPLNGIAVYVQQQNIDQP